MSHPNIANFRQRVTLRKAIPAPGGLSGFYASPQYDPIPLKLRARVEPRNQVVRQANGEEFISDRVALIHSPQHRISPLDEISFEGEENPPRILRVDRQPDRLGQYKVYRVSFGNSRRTG